MAAGLSLWLSSSMMPKPIHLQNPTPSLLLSAPPKTRLSFLSQSLISLTISSHRHLTFPFIIKATDAEAEVAVVEPENEESEVEPDAEQPAAEAELVAETSEPKREEVFAVIMVGSRQYIVFPGRYLYTQRLKGANVNDKITLNKVLLVGTKTSTWIGKPIVPNAVVHAVVEEQTLEKKVIVFKYKKKKNYRRNIGHRQPITRIRITSISGYQDSPAVTLH